MHNNSKRYVGPEGPLLRGSKGREAEGGGGLPFFEGFSKRQARPTIARNAHFVSTPRRGPTTPDTSVSTYNLPINIHSAALFQRIHHP